MIDRHYTIIIAVIWFIVGMICGGMIIGWAIIGDCDCRGDVNLDNTIDLTDAQLVAQHIVGTITLEGDRLDRADFNNDGAVNGLDLLLMVRQ